MQKQEKKTTLSQKLKKKIKKIPNKKKLLKIEFQKLNSRFSIFAIYRT